MDGKKFNLEDVRKDEECADTVGVFWKLDGNGKIHFRMTLGPQVQTLTKAMTAILCRGLERVKPKEVLELDSDLVPKIVGAQTRNGKQNCRLDLLSAASRVRGTRLRVELKFDL